MVLTDKGFQRPTYDDLLTRQENRAKTLFGEDIRLNVEDLAECYELLGEIYYAILPGSARGQSLDRRCVFAGITRNPATAASLKVRVYGNTGAIVPAAFMLVGNGKEFYVDVDYTVGGEGYADCYANCTEPGTGGNLTVGTEITIVNPDPDLERAELLAVDTYGEDRETDTALRIRYKKAVAGSGSATANAIRGALSRIAQVDGVAIAENVAPDEDDFVWRMNLKAQILGCVGTTFQNTNGLPDDHHQSCAYDLAVIARYALQNDTFSEIVQTPYATIHWVGKRQAQIKNTNRLLQFYPGAIGVKTGTTNAAGQCLIAAAERDEHCLIAVVLKSQNRFLDATNLLDYGFKTINCQ